MGLDAVEVMLAIEEEFAVSIDDEEMVCFYGTLGNLHDLLLEKCTGRKRPDCPTRAAFYRLRRAMAAAWGADPKSLRPSSEVLPLLGRRRHRNWARLQQELGLTLPPLANRAGLGAYWGAVTFAGGAAAVMLVVTLDPATAFAAGLVGLLPGVLLGYCAGIFLPPTTGPWCRTIGGIARVLAVENDQEFRDSEEPETKGDPIWERLCDILVRELRVRRETLHRGTRFVEDLGF